MKAVTRSFCFFVFCVVTTLFCTATFADAKPEPMHVSVLGKNNVLIFQFSKAIANNFYIPVAIKKVPGIIDCTYSEYQIIVVHTCSLPCKDEQMAIEIAIQDFFKDKFDFSFEYGLYEKTKKFVAHQELLTGNSNE